MDAVYVSGVKIAVELDQNIVIPPVATLTNFRLPKTNPAVKRSRVGVGVGVSGLSSVVLSDFAFSTDAGSLVIVVNRLLV